MAWWPEPVDSSTRWSPSASARPSCPSCAMQTSWTSRRSSGWPSYRFSGSIWGYGEGDLHFPQSPVMVVESTFAEGVLLETLMLSILNHDSAIALGRSAHGRRGPRTPLHRDGVTAHARGRRRGGGPGRSSGRLRGHLQPGGGSRSTACRRQGPAPTPSRCCTTPSATAFVAQVDALGPGTTLLVDTYDIAEAIRTAVDVAGPGLGAVRIDSGDLVSLAHAVRAPAGRPRRHAAPASS